MYFGSVVSWAFNIIIKSLSGVSKHCNVLNAVYNRKDISPTERVVYIESSGHTVHDTDIIACTKMFDCFFESPKILFVIHKFRISSNSWFYHIHPIIMPDRSYGAFFNTSDDHDASVGVVNDTGAVCDTLEEAVALVSRNICQSKNYYT